MLLGAFVASCSTAQETVMGDASATPDIVAQDVVTAPDIPMQMVNCGAVTSCTTCASLGPCGWCGLTNTCVAGNATGPSAGACAVGWTMNAATCTAPDAGTPDDRTGGLTGLEGRLCRA